MNASKTMQQVTSHVKTAIQQLQAMGIQTNMLTLDHACYRVETHEEYKKIKHLFSCFGQVFPDKNKQDVTIFKLYPPTTLQISGKSNTEQSEFSIEWIELPDVQFNKSGQASYFSGWEHIEFTLPPHLTFDEFMTQNPGPDYHIEGSNPDQPKVYLRIPMPRNERDVLVKFNHIPLAEKIKKSA